MTYELPADTYDGRVELQTLARRIARACVHFLQVSTRFALCIRLWPAQPQFYTMELRHSRPPLHLLA